MISPLIYAVAIPVALIAPPIASILYATVLAIWIVPDLRIERALTHSGEAGGRGRSG